MIKVSPKIPAVHFQFMTDNREIAKRLFGYNKPFLASIVPDLLDKTLKTEEGEKIYERIHPKDNYYPDWAIELFKANKDNPNVIWIQEGYRHCCGRCFNRREENRKAGKGNYPDIYHEHVCLDGHSQSLEKQVEIIRKGGGKLTQGLGITPDGYCPPNHLHNKDTESAARIKDFKYFLTRNGFDYFIPGLINLPAYEDYGLIIIPESNFGTSTKSPVSLTYYDHLVEREDIREEFFKFLDSSVPLSELPISKKSKAKVFLNRRLIYAAKRGRDLKNRIKRD